MFGQKARIKPFGASNPETRPAKVGRALGKQPMRLQRRLERAAASGEVPAKAPDLGVVMSQRHEIGQCALGMARRVPQNQVAKRPRLFDQRLRRHQISEPQARKHRFGKAADIDHAAVAILRLQGRCRGFKEIHLELIIILDNQEIVSLRQFQKRPPP